MAYQANSSIGCDWVCPSLRLEDEKNKIAHRALARLRARVGASTCKRELQNRRSPTILQTAFVCERGNKKRFTSKIW